MIDLSDALHASAATIDPAPDLAAFGVALTDADRTHRRRAVAAVATVAAAACVAGVAVARTSDASRSVDVAPAQRTGDAPYDGPSEIKVPDPEVVPSEVLVAAPEVGARPTFAVPDTAPPPSAPTDVVTPPTTPIGTFSASGAYGSCGGSAPYDYYSGEAPAGQTVSATSAYGSASVVTDPDGHWAMKVFFYDVVGKPAPKTFPVTISTAGHPSVVLSFTYTGP